VPEASKKRDKKKKEEWQDGGRYTGLQVVERGEEKEKLGRGNEMGPVFHDR